MDRAEILSVRKCTLTPLFHFPVALRRSGENRGQSEKKTGVRAEIFPRRVAPEQYFGSDPKL